MPDPRPTFLNTAGQRKGVLSGFETDDLEERYIAAYASRFEYSGLPEGCPDDYIERMMYLMGSVSGKVTAAFGPILCGASPQGFTTYGMPAKWTPVVVGSADAVGLFDPSDNPILYDYASMHERCAPYLEMMRKAANALNMNLVGLSNPILIQAAPGVELKGRIIKNNLGNGDIYLPVIDKGVTPAEVMDMKAQDHTANLLGVIHDMDGQILEMMGIRSTLEKASGISVEEASASDQQIGQFMEQELRKRQEWLDRLNPVLGTNISVRIAEGWTEEQAVPPEDEAEDQQEGEENATG